MTEKKRSGAGAGLSFSQVNFTAKVKKPSFPAAVP